MNISQFQLRYVILTYQYAVAVIESYKHKVLLQGHYCMHLFCVSLSLLKPSKHSIVYAFNITRRDKIHYTILLIKI